MEEKLEVDITVPNQTRYLSLIGKIGEDIARGLKRFKGDREELAYHVNVVLTEAMANVIVHANAGDPTREVHINLAVDNGHLFIRVYDEGGGFDAAALLPPSPDSLSECGRGIYIIRSLMDSVTYRRINGRHVLEMVKLLH